MNNGYSAEDIFDRTNPNANIFVVKGEKGAGGILDDDNRHSMIGDAVRKHESSLTSINRLLLHEMISFADGNLVMKEPNMYQVIHDHRDMDKDSAAEYLAAKGVFMDIDPNDMLEAGIMTGISIEDYEKNIEPREVPSTPRDKFRYCGNSRQSFYDSFPEDHPEADKMNMLLMMLKNNSERFFNEYIHAKKTNGTIEQEYHETWHDYFSQLIENWHENGTLSTTVACAFLDIIRFMVHECANESMIQDKITSKLTDVDESHGATVRFETDCRSLMGWEEGDVKHTANEAIVLLSKKEVEWDKHYKGNASTASLRQIYFDVCKTGAEMYDTEFNVDDSEITRRRKMGTAWFKYRSLKREYAPRLALNGVDINKCFHVSTLCNIAGFTNKQASAIVSRLIEKEFKNIDEVFKVIGVQQKDFITSDRKEAKVIIDIIDSEFNKSVKYKNMNRFLKIAPDLIKRQKEGEFTKELTVWKEVWKHYTEKKEEAIEVKAKFTKKAQARKGDANV